MPLYLYLCQSCGKEHEAIRKFSDPPLKRCPACGGTLKKKITATSFQLKGGGWYKDGYSTPLPEKKPAAETPTPKKEPAKPAEKKDKK